MTNTLQTISNEHLTVQINLKGAELWSIKDAEGTEYLWQGDPAYWSDRAINLFPYIARMTEKSYIYDGRKYQMDIHGFAKDTLFSIDAESTDYVTFKISDTPETLKQYPFSFDLYITYRLQGSSLKVEFKVVNKNNRTMYFGIGGHPGFNVPLGGEGAFEDWKLVFPQESQPVRMDLDPENYRYAGTEQPYPLENGTTIALTHDLFDLDAVVLRDMPRSVCICSPASCRSVTVDYPHMPFLGLWHKPHSDAPYVCIEPWVSLPSHSAYMEDISKQEHLIHLPAGETYHNIMTITLK